MRAHALIAAALLLSFPALASADVATTRVLQQSLQRLQNAQRSGPAIPSTTLSGLQESLQMMTRDQVNPAIFQVDKAIFDARMAGLQEQRQSIHQQTSLSKLQQQVQSLTSQHQALQNEYARLRQQLASKTMTGAQTQHLQAEIQQQKQMLQAEEKHLASLAKQPSSSLNGLSSSTAITSTSTSTTSLPAYGKALTVYAQVQAASDGVHVSMPADSLFGSDNRLSNDGEQRLQAISRILKQSNAYEILVRVAPQPLGANAATQRAEAILRNLRRNGVPDQSLALATGSGLAAGTAELLLVNASPTS
jgi:regulator of replication initiation timing